MNHDNKVPTKDDLENYLSNLVIYFREGMRTHPFTSYPGIKPGQAVPLGVGEGHDMIIPMIEVDML